MDHPTQATPEPALTIYGTPECTICTRLVAYCRRKSIPHTYVDLSRDSEALAWIRSLGYTSAPVSTIGDDHFHGYRIDKLKPLAQAAQQASALAS